MKTINIHFISKSIFIKYAVLTLFAFILGFTTSLAQKVVNIEETKNNINIEVCEFKTFSAKLLDGKVYLNWRAISSNNDCFFIIERSVNGKDYTTIGLKQGALSPNNIPLLYSFIDESPLFSSVFYRIKILEADGEMIVSISGELASN